MWPSFSTVLSFAFLGYVLHSTWTIYTLFTPPGCEPHEKCIPAYMHSNPKLRLSLFASTRKSLSSASELNPLWHMEDMDIGNTFETSINVTLPMQTRNNGSLYVHAFLMPKFQVSQSAAHLMSSPFAYYASCSLTSYLVSEAETFKLLGGENPDAKPQKSSSSKEAKQQPVVTHLRRKLSLSIMEDIVAIPAKNVPGELMKFLKITPHGEYLPILYIDTLKSRFQDFKKVDKEMDQTELIISYSPISFGKLRFVSQVESAMKLMQGYGFSEKDLDEVKGVFMDTNLHLLCITFIVAALHLLFDFLAFKNDISFWRQRKSMVGLSTRTLIWRCISHLIVFLYLKDEQTSLLILVPAGIGSVIEIWKLTKAFRITLNWYGVIPIMKFGTPSEEEMRTDEYDAQSMKYLSYLLYPLCIGGAVYSLLYTPHKGWYSWCIQSLVNGVYAFGFLFMLPQLFVNYKHKSVAHLPWRAFTYKAFNTFIDDIFAFIVTMPTAHRVACFRDDVVFFVYLYQRWLYPVDKSRVNEFGESFVGESKKNWKESKAAVVTNRKTKKKQQ